MRLCADTWYLLEISKKDKSAVKLLKDVERGKHILFIPIMCIAELFVKLFQMDKPVLAKAMLAQLSIIRNVLIVPMEVNVAIETARREHSLGLSIVDASILATSIVTGSEVFLANDEDYKDAVKQGVVVIKKPKELV